VSYSLRYVFGISGSKCDRTAKLLEQRSIDASQLSEEDSGEGLTSESGADMDTDTEGGAGPTGGEGFLESRTRRFNRDDVTLSEWRRLAGIQ